MTQQLPTMIATFPRRLAARLLSGTAAIAVLALLLAGCGGGSPTAGPAAMPSPTDSSAYSAPPATPTSQPAVAPPSGVATSTALWPDGQPVANTQMIFEYGNQGGDYSDLHTDAQGQFPTPDSASCNPIESLCELWIGVPTTEDNQTLLNQRTRYTLHSCLLPLSASSDPQTYPDIQLSTDSPSTLIVANADCVQDDAFDGNTTGWQQTFASSQASPGTWLTTTDIERLSEAGSLDESTPLGYGTAG